MLVLFLFFCSLAPNPNFYRPHGLAVTGVVGRGYFFCLRGLGVGLEDFESISNTRIWVLQPFLLLEGGGAFIYSWLGVYLFFVMILVVKISPKMGGAVRIL